MQALSDTRRHRKPEPTFRSAQRNQYQPEHGMRIVDVGATVPHVSSGGSGGTPAAVALRFAHILARFGWSEARARAVAELAFVTNRRRA